MSKVYDQGENWKTGSSLKRQRMEQYLEWAITPPQLREPKTKKGFAESIEVTVNTLGNYDRDAWFQREAAKRSRGLFKATSASDVIATLTSIATDKEHKNAVSAARLLLEWMDKGVEDNADKAGFDDLTLDELQEKISRLRSDV